MLVVVDSLTEAEATDALEYLSRTRPAGTSTQEVVNSALLDDEPFTKEDVQALAEARAEPDGMSLEEARSELR